MALENAHALLREIDYDTVSGIVLSAIAVALADGQLKSEEFSEAAQTVSTAFAGQVSSDEVWHLVFAAYARCNQHGYKAALQEAQSHLQGGRAGEAAVVVAAAVAGRSGGIGQAEGVAIQQVARSVGVEPGGSRYFQLLAEGQRMGRA
jgi:tellurite resistance protein